MGRADVVGAEVGGPSVAAPGDIARATPTGDAVDGEVVGLDGGEVGRLLHGAGAHEVGPIGVERDVAEGKFGQHVTQAEIDALIFTAGDVNPRLVEGENFSRGGLGVAGVGGVVGVEGGGVIGGDGVAHDVGVALVRGGAAAEIDGRDGATGGELGFGVVLDEGNIAGADLGAVARSEEVGALDAPVVGGHAEAADARHVDDDAIGRAFGFGGLEVGVAAEVAALDVSAFSGDGVAVDVDVPSAGRDGPARAGEEGGETRGHEALIVGAAEHEPRKRTPVCADLGLGGLTKIAVFFHASGGSELQGVDEGQAAFGAD